MATLHLHLGVYLTQVSSASGHISFPWAILWVKRLSIIAVGDIDAFVSRDGVWINRKRGCYRVLPFFLHLRMHHQEGIVRQMNGNLSFSVRTRYVVGIILGDSFANAKLSGNP